MVGGANRAECGRPYGVWPALSRKVKTTIPLASLFAATILLDPASGWSQAVSFSLTAGVPLNDRISAAEGQTASTGRFTFGPSLRLGLPRGFGVDVELLYKWSRFGFASIPEHAVVHRMELPLLFRYRFSGSRVHPWLHAGLSFSRVVAVSGADLCARNALGEESYCIGGETAAVLRHRHTHGPVLGAGMEFAWGRVHIAPELRITHWVDRNFGTRDSSLRSNLTELDALVGLRF